MPRIGIGILSNSLIGGPLKPNGNPSSLVLTVLSDTSIKCDWTIGSTNHDGHYIYFSTDNVTFTLNGTVTGTTATYTSTSLLANTLYYFKVVAYKGSKLSNYTSTVSDTTLVATILDSYTAAMAFSFRKLRTAYSGSCLKIRRSSDDTTQDIGFVNNAIDTTSLLAFVGSGDGYIDTFYDQSGNNQHIAHATKTKQPILVTSGVINTDADGMICCTFDATDDGLYRANVTLFKNVGYIETFMVLRNRNTSIGTLRVYSIISSGGGYNNVRMALGPDWTGGSGKTALIGRRLDADTAAILNSATSNNTNKILITGKIDYTNSNGYIYFNGNLDSSNTSYLTDGDTQNTDSVGVSIGGVINGTTSANKTNIDFQEFIAFNTDVSAGETIINSNILTYWNFNMSGFYVSGNITYNSSIDAI